MVQVVTTFWLRLTVVALCISNCEIRQLKKNQKGLDVKEIESRARSIWEQKTHKRNYDNVEKVGASKRRQKEKFTINRTYLQKNSFKF